MLFSQSLLIIGAFLTTSTLGLALQPRDTTDMKPPPAKNGGNGAAVPHGTYKFCYAIQVTLSPQQNTKFTAAEKVKHIKMVLESADTGGSKVCGKESINAGANPGTGTIIKAFMTKQQTGNRGCHEKNGKGKCELGESLTMSQKDAGDCGSCTN